MQSVVIQMNDRQLQTLAQLQAFLDGTAAQCLLRRLVALDYGVSSGSL
jgi:hypothetical protein